MCCPMPLAPHEAARRAGLAIDMAKLVPPASDRPLVVEGAGGLMVPLGDQSYVIDLARDLDLPLILVARSTLGTINHTLLSLEAIRRRGLPLAGVVINGPRPRTIAPRSSATGGFRSSPRSPGSIR